jgi:hypothetical protein
VRHSHSRVAEEVLLQPWFLPRRVAFAIHGLIPPDFHLKMRYFFDDYGCMICGKRSNYHSNAMCGRCGETVRKKLIASVMRRSKSRSNRRLDLALFRQQSLAKSLLGRFAPASRNVTKTRTPKLPQRSNPVYEALCARFE